MAKIGVKYYQGVGKGYEISTTVLPISGTTSVLRSIIHEVDGVMRYSLDGGVTYTDWTEVTDAVIHSLSTIRGTYNTVLNYVPVTANKVKNRAVLDINSIPKNNNIYSKTVFSQFFESNDVNVVAWALNVLEKLFEPGILPTFVKRDNAEDFNVFFLAVTHYFAYIVLYARQFRQLENSETLMKEFIEGWGLVYENVDTLEQRKWLFNNWINEFSRRGTEQIADTGGTLEGELRRLVGYTKPNEFIFGRLAPQDVGWCLGWSSPTWFGTETVNAVSKGYDYGIDYAGVVNAGVVNDDVLGFSDEEVTLPKEGTTQNISIITDYPWQLYIGEDVPAEFLEVISIGVGPEKNYPIIGDVTRKFVNNICVFQPVGSGISGISSEVDRSKLMEVYYGMDYEITVWIQARDSRPQNIDFGIQCFDANLNQITQVRITDFRESNSFFDTKGYHSPCKIPGLYYRLRGIVYNLTEGKDEALYLNFEGGRPLRFIGDVKYMAPYIVQDRSSDVADIIIAGVTVKPLELPFSQGYLGQKNVIAMYSVIRSARTQQDIEEFVRRYLVSYKNIVKYKWIQLTERLTRFLTFYLTRELDGAPIEGAEISLSNGFKAQTDEEGYLRFDIRNHITVQYTITAKGIVHRGSITIDGDKRVDVVMNIPMDVNFTILEENSWGSAKVSGSRLPYTDIVLTATPARGYTFIKWVIPTDSFTSQDNPLDYNITDHDIDVQAVFELTSGLILSTDKITIPADGTPKQLSITSNKKWEVESYSEDWAELNPSTGNSGVTNVNVEITKKG